MENLKVLLLGEEELMLVGHAVLSLVTEACYASPSWMQCKKHSSKED